ncbi:helix-turn-helix domain-containing protein [Clostridium niameyense]|uniref:Helix-turn-helix domain-containing protein n=1 Tax=Clostridium niameyense TaxID=1622073 RepID=A0A6M0R963_9CLOT|nr:helix-turn-helix domain-containing protein [Clostridium niameyense]NEZ46119.1 helix-turn-helix domain-containing protein [Clostridium niameyense]
MAIVHERIKKERIEKGINQPELAKALNVSKQTVSNWENGKRTPDADTLTKIADFFNCSVDYLLGITDTKNKINTIDLFSGVGKLQLDSLKKALLKTNEDNNLLFSIMLEEKLKEANLYSDGMSDEEKIELANKILDILKLIKNK